VNRHVLLWIVAAALGIVLAAALTWSASQLAGQHIGLASAPLSVQNGLAPDVHPPLVHPHRQVHVASREAPPENGPRATSAPTAASTLPAPPAPAMAPVTPSSPAQVTTPTSVARAASAAPQQSSPNRGNSNDGSGDSSGAGSQRDD
jgi:hypothetical protein